MIKIIFFDIDGTLIEIGQKDFHPQIKKALRLLRQNGILCFIATGRAPFMVPARYIDHFDGLMDFNGAYAKTTKNEIIRKAPLDKDDVLQLKQNADACRVGIAIAGEDRLGSNIDDPALTEYFEVANQSCKPIELFNRYLDTHDIYQVMTGNTKALDEQILRNTKNVKIVRWYQSASDIILKNGGKDIGMQAILDHYHFSQQQCMAFGDGGNDADMLRYAHIGVAVENAVSQAKEAADYICPPVDQLGVIEALKHYQLL